MKLFVELQRQSTISFFQFYRMPYKNKKKQKQRYKKFLREIYKRLPIQPEEFLWEFNPIY